MKRKVLQLGLAVFSVLGYSSSFAHSTRIIYGLVNAQHFHEQTKQDVYIQAGNFKEKSKAYRQQRVLKSKTTHAVKIVMKGKLYAVLIGPLHTQNEIRKTATSLLTSPKKTPSFKKTHPHITTIKPIPVVFANPPKHHAPTKIIDTNPMPETYGQSQIPTIAKREAPVSRPQQPTSNWFVAAGAGAQFPSSMDDMAVNNGSGLPAPYNQDLYAINTDSGATIALSAGRRWQRDSVWMPAYSAGVSWQYYFNTQVGNTIMQYSDPAFLNYNYNWNVKSNLLLATAKLNLVQYGRLSPYINGSLGAAYNNASGYSETARSGVTPRVSPGFANSTSTQFAYQVGTGVDVQITPQVIFSLGYNHENLGCLSSGAGAGTWSNKTLSSGSYGSNQVLASVNYLFGN